MSVRLLAALLGLLLVTACGASQAQDDGGGNDGGYVPCEGVTMTRPDGETIEPDPDNPACPD